MLVSIAEEIVEYQSRLYQKIIDDICLKGYQTISISGPRNSSKTFFEWLILLFLHQEIGGLVSVVCMKEYAMIAKTFIPTLKEICEFPLKHDKNPWVFEGGEKRPLGLKWKNGGETWFLGMAEDGKKVRGLAADVVLYGQIELEDNDNSFREIAGAQAGGRKGNLKLDEDQETYLFIGDCNPGSKKHWWYKLKGKEIHGWYDVKHRDHPLFFDHEKDVWKPKGIQTRKDLARLYPPGHWYDRMVDGLWCISEGGCFTEFDEDIHVREMDIGDYGSDTLWRIGVDFGNTTAAGLYAELPNGETHLFKEYYKFDPSPTLLVDYFRYWERTYGILQNMIHKMVTDIETGNRAILRESGYLPIVANKEVPITEGIQIIQRQFRDGKLFINKDSLEHPDPLLEGKMRCLVDELPEIHYPLEKDQTGRKSDDKPAVGCIRHAADHLRYICVDTYKRIPLSLETFSKIRTVGKRERW